MGSQRVQLTNFGELWELIQETAAQWTQDKVPRHGAALAYYTVFSIVPLLVIIIAMIGLVFGQEAAQSYILQQLESLLGEQSTAAIKDMIQRASQPSTGILATLVALATLLFGASGLFGQLQDSLNSIWGVEPKTRGIWGIVQDRFFSFMAVLGTGFLLLVSLVLSAGLAALGKWFGGWLPAPEVVLQMLNALISFTVITALFAMMFRYCRMLVWRGVMFGSGRRLRPCCLPSGNSQSGFISAKATWDPPTARLDRWQFCWCGSTTRRRFYCSEQNLPRSMPIGLVLISFPPITQ